MRIEQPQLEIANGLATVRARVVLNTQGGSFPEELWFSIPEDFGHLCAPDFEPFAVALSSLASALNEDIEIDGAFSERLSVGLDEYWRILSTWEPKKFNPLRLKYQSVRSEVRSDGHAAAAFSGGVDSFFTQYLNRERPTGFRTKYAVFIHGLDIPLSEANTFEEAASAYEAVLRENSVDLIRMTSNMRSFFLPGFWEIGHGTALCGAALVLSPGINRFFIPSSKTYGTLDPWGSHPLTDGLLSTDGTQIIHDGAYYTRFDKLNLMKDWEPFRKFLRTCYKEPAAFQNCGRCQKCRRTMMVLASLGVLDHFPTFPAVRSASHFINCRWETAHERLFGSQVITHSLKHRRFGLASAGLVAMQTSQVRKALKKPKVLSRRLRRALAGN